MFISSKQKFRGKRQRKAQYNRAVREESAVRESKGRRLRCPEADGGLQTENGEREIDVDTDGKNFGNKGFVCGVPDRGRHGESRQSSQLYAPQG